MQRLLILLLLVLCGCSVVEMQPPAVDSSQLTSGALLFGEPVKGIRAADLLTLDDEMLAFVKSQTGKTHRLPMKLKYLLDGMIEDGLLTLEYVPNVTNTAQETFHSKQGNCLSFSVLFVALARAAGLDAEFQVVDVPPTFTTSGELVVLNDHINVLVRGVRDGTRIARDQIVDFSNADYRGAYQMTRVSDEYALALFHSNRAVEQMRRGDMRRAFSHLKTAIELEPEIPGLWANLGVLYAKEGHYDQAVLAYNRALWNEPSNQTALSNLATVYERMGQNARAKEYRDRVAYYLDHNPYYHYYQAKFAYDEQRYEDSLAELEGAISLQESDHRFYALQGLNYYALNDRKKATESFQKAKMLADDGDRARYSGKLLALQRGS